MGVIGALTGSTLTSVPINAPRKQKPSLALRQREGEAVA